MATPAAATKLALRSIARRHRQLTAEIKAIDAELAQLTADGSGPPTGICVGPNTAAALLITTGTTLSA